MRAAGSGIGDLEQDTTGRAVARLGDVVLRVDGEAQLAGGIVDVTRRAVVRRRGRHVVAHHVDRRRRRGCVCVAVLRLLDDVAHDVVGELRHPAHGIDRVVERAGRRIVDVVARAVVGVALQRRELRLHVARRVGRAGRDRAVVERRLDEASGRVVDELRGMQQPVDRIGEQPAVVIDIVVVDVVGVRVVWWGRPARESTPTCRCG